MLSAPTFLFVHGAWHGSWVWRRVGDILDERGVTWSSVDLPSSSRGDPSVDLTSDVFELRRSVRDLGPVVLVAHSYAGVVAAEAAPRIAHLRGIVYLAALVPRPGQSASDVTREYASRSALDAAIYRDEGLLRLDPVLAAPALYGDCDEQTRQWAINKVSAQSLASFRSVRTSENIAVATTYVMCERDEALSPEVQYQVAQRCDDIVTMDSDHSPFLSHPQELVNLLDSMNFH